MIAGMLEESYPRIYKSAPLPEKPQENHIANVVGRNFNEVVLDPHKDVLLMVYVNRYDAPPLLNALYNLNSKVVRHSISPLSSGLEDQSCQRETGKRGEKRHVKSTKSLD